jgi:hypothetical protein
MTELQWAYGRLNGIAENTRAQAVQVYVVRLRQDGTSTQRSVQQFDRFPPRGREVINQAVRRSGRQSHSTSSSSSGANTSSHRKSNLR